MKCTNWCKGKDQRSWMSECLEKCDQFKPVVSEPEPEQEPKSHDQYMKCTNWCFEKDQRSWMSECLEKCDKLDPYVPEPEIVSQDDSEANEKAYKKCRRTCKIDFYSTSAHYSPRTKCLRKCDLTYPDVVHEPEPEVEPEHLHSRKYLRCEGKCKKAYYSNSLSGKRSICINRCAHKYKYDH